MNTAHPASKPSYRRAGARRALAASLRVALGGTALAAALWLVGAPLDAVSPVATAQAADAKQPKLSNEVVKKLKPAQEALQKGDFDTAITLSQDAQALAKSPYDQEMSLRIRMAAYGNKKDYPAYASALEELLALNPESMTPEEKTKSYKQLSQIYYQAQKYDKVQHYAQLWADGGGGSEAYEVLAASYLVQKDCKNGVVPLEKSVEGKEPPENKLRQLNFCYYQNGDKAKREATMEALATRFPKRDYFIDLLGIYQIADADSRAVLNMFRLGFDRDWLTREQELLEYADMAIEAGSPAEAQKIVDSPAGKAAVKGGERADRVRAQSKQLAAEDRKSIASLDKEAAAGKNGDADVKVGLAYLGLGDNEKAVAAIRRGLAPEKVAKVKRVDDANMMLGIALTRLGRRDEAQKAFEEARKDPRMTKVADLWLKVAAPAPAAAPSAS